MNFVKEKTVCFSGHRRERLPKYPDTLEQLQSRIFIEIEKAVSDGFNTSFLVHVMVLTLCVLRWFCCYKK